MSNTSTETKLAFSIAEACRASSLGRTKIYELISTGQLHTVRIGGRRLIPAESLHSLIMGKA